MKKAVSEKPVVDEEKFEETVKEWEEKLATAYEEYKKKQETTATQNGEYIEKKHAENSILLRDFGRILS